MKAKVLYRDLILSSIDLEGYEKENTLENLHEVFMSEYGWRVAGAGKYVAAKDWLMGLASACTIPFANHDIWKWGVEKGLVAADANDGTIDAFIEGYWTEAANALVELID